MGFFILIHCAQDDYKSLVDKYCLVRDDFERKMTLAAKHFQDVESAHLKQMREFIESYCQIVDNNNNLLGRVRILFLKSNIRYTEMQFASFFSGGLITAIVVNPPERRLAKRNSLHWLMQ